MNIIQKRLEEYMHEPKNGGRHEGRTPWELWKERIERKPLRKLADETRWIFASHFKRVKIRDGRIWIRGIQYTNDAVVAWNTKEVWAYFNVECPDVLVIADLKRTQFHAVRSRILPARNATPEQFAAARQDLGAYNRKAREIYHSITHPLKSSVTRDEDFSETTKEIGRLINTQVSAQKELAMSEERIMEKIRCNCERLNRAMPATIRNPAAFLSA